MSSFSCPHLEFDKNVCIKLNVECIPGRKGCVLRNKVDFMFPAEERQNDKKEKIQNKREK